MRVVFEFLEEAVFSELASSSYALAEGEAEELSEDIWVLVLVLTSAAFFFTENMYKEGSLCVESSWSEN